MKPLSRPLRPAGKRTNFARIKGALERPRALTDWVKRSKVSATAPTLDGFVGAYEAIANAVARTAQALPQSSRQLGSGPEAAKALRQIGGALRDQLHNARAQFGADDLAAFSAEVLGAFRDGYGDFVRNGAATAREAAGTRNYSATARALLSDLRLDGRLSGSQVKMLAGVLARVDRASIETIERAAAHPSRDFTAFLEAATAALTARTDAILRLRGPV